MAQVPYELCINVEIVEELDREVVRFSCTNTSVTRHPELNPTQYGEKEIDLGCLGDMIKEVLAIK